MNAARVLLLSLLLCCVPLRGQAIPVTHATSLANTDVNLPDDLKGRVAILLLGFSKSSSRQTKFWSDRIERDFGSDSEIVFYEIPMLQQVPRLLRGVVLDGMRKPLSTAQRRRFLPVFDNEEVWKAVTHFADSNEAYVLLVDGLGQIKWQSSGAFQEDKYDGLRKRVAVLECAPTDRDSGSAH